MADNHNVNAQINSIGLGAINAIKSKLWEVESNSVEVTRLANTTDYTAKDNVSSTVAIKQKEEITFTGTSGTLNINVAGLTLLATFDTDISQTAINFESAHVLNLAAVGVTLTRNLEVIVLEATVAGVPFATATKTQLTGNLDAAIAITAVNVTNNALAINIDKQQFDSSKVVRVTAKTNMPGFAAKTILVRLWASRSSVVDDDNVASTDSYLDELIADIPITFGAAYNNVCRGESAISQTKNFIMKTNPIIVTVVATEAITPTSGGKLNILVVSE